jgi:hypothetical protein
MRRAIVSLGLDSWGWAAVEYGGRAARVVEVKILEIWREAHLNSAKFWHGNVRSMFRRVH